MDIWDNLLKKLREERQSHEELKEVAMNSEKKVIQVTELKMHTVKMTKREHDMVVSLLKGRIDNLKGQIAGGLTNDAAKGVSNLHDMILETYNKKVKLFDELKRVEKLLGEQFDAGSVC